MRPFKVLAHRLPERLGLWPRRLRDRIKEEAPYLWIHGASVGEVHLSLKVAEALKGCLPYPILITSMTPEGIKVAEGKADLSLPFPLPFGPPVEIYLERTRPRGILIAETELWPPLLLRAKKRGIPVVLFNGRISSKALKSFRAFRLLYRESLKAFSLLLVRSEEDRKRFLEIGAPPDRTRVTGDLKLSRPFIPRPERAQALKEELRLQGHRVWVTGSLHPGEEEQVLWAFSKLKGMHQDLRLILVPRHLGDVGQMLQKARAFGLKPALRTEKGREWDCLVVNTVGELRDLYGLADLALVGGSMIKGVGGHNLLEPLCWGVPTLYGPHGENFAEIVRRLLEVEALYLVEDGEGILRACEAILSCPASAKERARRAEGLFYEGERALELTLGSILEVLGG